MTQAKLHIIGELMNNSYGRARRAWQAGNLEGYQELAKLQTELGASHLTLNIDGTQKIAVSLQEMLDFLPRVIPAIQEVTDVPLSFDNPDIAFHYECLKHYDPAKARARPILNSISVSRKNIGEMIGLARDHDMNIIGMASECLRENGSHGPAENVKDIVDTTRHFVAMLREQGGISNDRIIIDPGFGFGKTVNHNLTLLRRLRDFRSLGCPVLMGTSRKSTIGKVLDLPAEERLEGTAATCTCAIMNGADIIRVHDVEAMVRVARMTDAVVRGFGGEDA